MDQLRFQITAYCGTCGWDVCEVDEEDLDSAINAVEHKSDLLYAEHVRLGKCQ